MEINRKTLKEIITEILKEIDLTESDIVAKEKSEWKSTKKEFKKTISELLKSIEDDNYTDATGEIDKAMKTLRLWKKRIAKNLNDSTGF